MCIPEYHVFELQIAMKVSEVCDFSAMLDQSRGQAKIIRLLIYPQFKYIIVMYLHQKSYTDL